MKNYLVILLFTLLTVVYSSTAAQNYTYFDGNNVRVGSRAARPEPLISYCILEDKDFDCQIAEARRKEVGSKQQDYIWVMFHLPADCDRTEVTIRKSYMKAQYIIKVNDFINNVLYTYSFRSQVPLGYHDMSMYQDSKGNWEFSMTNPFSQGAGPAYVTGSGMIVFGSQYHSPRAPLGGIQGKMERDIERVGRSEETFIFFRDNKRLEAQKTLQTSKGGAVAHK